MTLYGERKSIRVGPDYIMDIAKEHSGKWVFLVLRTVHSAEVPDTLAGGRHCFY